jgi:cytosine/adenosine deaminase-related metal-dependent hydrolase
LDRRLGRADLRGRRGSTPGRLRTRLTRRRARHAGLRQHPSPSLPNADPARAQQADLFSWLRELYPVWAGIDAEAEYAAARTGLAELALSGCSTVFDHHYVFPTGRAGLVEAEIKAARELGVRLVASRGSMNLGVSDGGLPPDELVEEIVDDWLRSRRGATPW